MSSQQQLAEIVRASHTYTGGEQQMALPFAESAVLLVVERADDGWCRGFARGKQGWFPASYVKTISNEQIAKCGLDKAGLVVMLRSPQIWIPYATADNRVYFVNGTTQETSWTMPSTPPPAAAAAANGLQGMTAGGTTTAAAATKPPIKKAEHRSRKAKYQVINGLTFIVEGGEEQELLSQAAPSLIDHFWADSGDQTGFDVLLDKHLNGKFAIKEMIDFLKERAAIEEQYARSLSKLSKSTAGDIEEGTLHNAWLAIKSELRHKAESHSKFATKLTDELAKPMYEFKESQKTTRKEHQQILERSRKQVQSMDASIEKIKSSLSGKGLSKNRKGSTEDRRKSSSGEEMKKVEANYNQVQRAWVDNMIAACRDFERQEEERSDFLKEKFLQYLDICVEVDEENAKSLSLVTDRVENIQKKADREFFIKRRGTGTLRPVDRPGGL